MEQLFCITLRQDVPDFNNITKVKETSFIGASNYKFWSKITPRFLTVELEAKEIPSRAVVPNWWVADPFAMGRQTLTGKKISSEK